MPRQIHKIDKFEGGISKNSDPRAISDNELHKCEGMSVSEPGKLQFQGADVAHPTISGGPTNGLVSPGYGLHFFKHDYPKLTSADHYPSQEDTATKIEANPNEYALLTNSTDTKISAYSYDDDAFETGSVASYIGFTQAGFNAAHIPKHIFFTANGNTRVIDTNFDNITNSNTGDSGQKYRLSWLGFIKRNRWANTDYDTLTGPPQYAFDGDYGPCFQGWYSTDAHCYAPETYNSLDEKPFIGYMKIREQDERIASNYYSNTLPDDNKFHLSIKYTKTSEGGWRGFKKYYITFIYDGVQESMPSAFNGLDEVWEDSIKEFRLYHRPKDTYKQFKEENDLTAEMYPLNPRITGGRVYFRDVDSDRKETGDLFLLFEFDLEHGVKNFLAEEWSGWHDCASQGGDNNINNRPWVLRAPYFKDDNGDIDELEDELSGMLRFKTEPTGPTYEALSGLQNNETSIYAAYKTFTIVNNRLYAGNIARFDTKKKGGTSVTLNADLHRTKDDVIINGDAMVKSVVNCYDVLPTSNTIEVTVGDGDDITCLENYADRILQYKTTKMHIINVSQDFEFLEGTFEDKGVWGPGAVCKTDFGVAWVNEIGCYMYDGKQVTNLLERKGVKLIKNSDWSTFIGTNPGIGFLPRERKLIVLDSYDSSDSGGVFIYDMVYQSWVNHDDRLDESNHFSNFVLDKDRQLYWRHTPASGSTSHRIWDDSPLKSYIDLRTKDIDFGLPTVRKKVYKVYITYKGTGLSNLIIRYAVNGEYSQGSMYQFNSDNTPLTDHADVSKWQTIALIPTTSSQANNIYSIAIDFNLSSPGSISDNFSIKDISIVYRVKNVK
tara:strand:+ start:3180 stop:5675 length:2496 start_codon:yes stop_codon:yes gene_type:complete